MTALAYSWRAVTLLVAGFCIIMYARVKDAVIRVCATATAIAAREGEVTNRRALRSFVHSFEAEWWTFQHRAVVVVRIDEGTPGVDEDYDSGWVHGLRRE